LSELVKEGEEKLFCGEEKLFCARNGRFLFCDEEARNEVEVLSAMVWERKADSRTVLTSSAVESL
jgi:hypothetical protein